MRNVLWITLALPLLWASPVAFAWQDQDTATIDTFIAHQARLARGEEYKEARKVMTGDLNHDGIADVAVLYTIEGQNGSNNYVQYLAVFLRTKDALVPVAHIGTGGKSNRSVELTSIDDNIIHLATLSYGPKDASCCPSIKGKTHYILIGRRLQEKPGARR